MTYFFHSDHLLLAKHAHKLLGLKHKAYLTLQQSLMEGKTINSTEEYNTFIHSLLKKLLAFPSPSVKTLLFTKELHAITKAQPLSEKVIWGGVTLKKVDVEKDFIQKLLVIKKSGILGFEIHKKKLEKLRVVEGVCVVLFSNHQKKGWKKGAVSIALAASGDTFTFEPGDEHGILALTNCVIEETSTNHLDDLVYLFPSDQLS